LRIQRRVGPRAGTFALTVTQRVVHQGDLVHELKARMTCRADELGSPFATRWDAVDYPMVRRYLSYLSRAKYARKTIARKLSSLRTFFKYLLQQGVISANPAGAAATPKLGQPLPRFLYADEIERLLNTPDSTRPLGQRDRAILELLYAGGLRASELSGLNVHDVDFSSRQVRVVGKGSKERIALVGKPALEALDRYLQDGREQQLRKAHEKGRAADVRALFLNHLGTRLSSRSVQRVFDRHVLAAGLQLDVSPHVLRHTFATHMLDRGADLRTVQELLGHASLATTQIYTHVTPQQLKRDYEDGHPLAKKQKTRANR
ncbi:MAG: tyrosine recombinase XerC, partial [Armatimonadota bacterium]